MKIGIMTFWWSTTNYGQILQCYALQKYLQNAGHDAYLIRLDWASGIPAPVKTSLVNKIKKAFNPIRLYNFLLKKVYLRQNSNQIKLRNFESFRNKFIKQSEKIYSCNELLNAPPEADVYIVGSDQVWNSDFLQTMDLIRVYFLDFGKPAIRRMSYAASFGKESLNDAFTKKITPLIQKFNYVSVREKSGLNICNLLNNTAAEWVPDPTLLLDIDVYRMIYKGEFFKKPGRPYCVLYLIGNNAELSVQNIQDYTYSWAKRNNMDVIYITGNLQEDKYKKTYPTIPEWLYLIEHAEYVITDSYHSFIFSLIFCKKFGIIPRIGNSVSRNTRLESLFDLFQLEKRYINNSDFSVLYKDIDWQLVSDTLESIRNTSKLREIIQLEK